MGWFGFGKSWGRKPDPTRELVQSGKPPRTKKVLRPWEGIRGAFGKRGRRRRYKRYITDHGRRCLEIMAKRTVGKGKKRRQVELDRKKAVLIK